MNKTQIPPQGLNWLTTSLVVRDPERAIEFYTKQFGFECHCVLPGSDGSIIFARITYKNINITMTPHNPPFEGYDFYTSAPVTTHSIPSFCFYMYCDDIEERYERARKNKLEILLPLKEQIWGDKMFRVRDPDGYIWEFAQPIQE